MTKQEYVGLLKELRERDLANLIEEVPLSELEKELYELAWASGALAVYEAFELRRVL